MGKIRGHILEQIPITIELFSSDSHDLLLLITIGGVKNPLGRDRMLCRGEFGAAVFEKRRSIRSRRAGKAFFGIVQYNYLRSGVRTI